VNVYLAGGISRGWRDELKERWSSHELVDPFRDLPQGTVAEFTRGDLQAVRECDLVFGVHDYHVYGGLALEFGFAHALLKPIIYVCLQPRVDSMMAGVSTAVFTEVEAATAWAERKFWL
jgi:nucleoside 2-deoxyribosyltransferase